MIYPVVHFKGLELRRKDKFVIIRGWKVLFKHPILVIKSMLDELDYIERKYK